MTPELSQTLAALASKLGTTADRVFPALVDKVYLEACLTFYGCGFIALLLLLCAGICWKNRAKLTDFTAPGVYISLVLFLLVSAVSASAIGTMLYPEAAAIQSLVSGKTP